METQEAIFLAVVLLVGIPSARYNLTSVGLVASYGLVQGIYLVTEQAMTVTSMLLADYAVIVLICAKPDAVECKYKGLLSQLCALWGERSRADKIILSIFPFVWLLYAIDFAAFYRYWALWWLALLQVLVAGWEGYSIWRQRLNTKDHISPDASSGLMWASYA